MPRLLLTGASGLLGRAVMKEFTQAAGWEVLGLSFSRTSGNLRKVDLTRPDQVEAVVAEFRPDIVVHAAAERRPDVVEGQKDATENLNVTATETLCKAAAATNASVLYMSTDYVFDGNNAPYKETDAPNPLSYYGQTKLEGERVVLKVSPENMVLRVPILYGDVEFVSESAVTVLFNPVKDNTKETAHDDYLRRFPTHVGDVASVIHQLLDKKVQDKSLGGIFHCSGKECMTKYAMCLVIAEVFGLSTSHIKPVTTQPTGPTKRPYDANLSCERLEKLGIGSDRTFREGIKCSLQSYL